MKNLRFKVTVTMMATAVMCVLGLGLHSCLDEKVDSYARLTIGTIEVIEDNDYFFTLDDGTTMYPGDTTNIHNYTPVTGQRAIVYFDLLDEEVPGYDYNALIYRIENILTKDIYHMPTEKEDSIGDDRINLNNVWISGNYVNVQYQFYYNAESGKTHMLNLVVNDSAPLPADAPLPLEFRHNAYGDTPLQGGTGIVSFRLDSVRGLLETGRDVRIRVHTLYNGVKYFDIPRP